MAERGFRFTYSQSMWRGLFSFMLWSLYTWGENQSPTGYEAGLDLDMVEKISNLYHPACSQTPMLSDL
jgi:hypothetical protein